MDNMGGIDRAFLPAVAASDGGEAAGMAAHDLCGDGEDGEESSIPSPPPIGGGIGVGGGATSGINVDNIFASMTESVVGVDRPTATASAAAGGGNDSSIFRSFAHGGIGGGIDVPIRKYSDHTNDRSRANVISGGTIPAHDGYRAGRGNVGYGNRGNAGGNVDEGARDRDNELLLSKSVGTQASFLRRSSRNVSASESDPTNDIRHAGYLLKRSNLPYIASAAVQQQYEREGGPSNVVTNGIAPLPDLGRYDDGVGTDADAVASAFDLPFGGTGAHNNDATIRVGNGDNVARPHLGAALTDDFFRPVSERSPMGEFGSTEDDDGCDDGQRQQPCFCSPVVEHLRRVLRINKRGSAVVPSNGAGEGVADDRTPSLIPVLPVARDGSGSTTVKSYTVPLKPAQKSEPMPISPMGGPRDMMKRNIADVVSATLSRENGGSDSGGQLSRSLSNGDIVPTRTNATTATAKKGGYPPPPPDYVDPKDGHIWRAKYCVLEEGILYFYRTAEEGESEEAQVERVESRMYSDDDLGDIVLGEVHVGNDYNFASPMRRGSTASQQQQLLQQRTMSGRDLRNLSKSPVPMRKSEVFGFAKSPFHRHGSSAVVDDRPSPNCSGPLRHSSSTTTFQHDADILWEKRVALDCVGAVRSSEQEHGDHAFELLAYGSEEGRGDCDDDASSRASRDSSGRQRAQQGRRQQEIVDRLILRAGGSDDMNAWMFQFHRSLTSFMHQILAVKSVRSGPDRAANFLGMGMMKPESPNHRFTAYAGPAGAGVSSFISSKQSFASSPIPGGNNSFGGDEGIVGSLSHGHGRNALYRRQVRDRDGKSGKDSGKDSPAISPLPTPTGTPLGGSPIDSGSAPSTSESGSLSRIKQILPAPGLMVQADPLTAKKKIDLPSLRNLRGDIEEKKTSPLASPKKYVPPHMRSAAPKKYVPPHMRNKADNAIRSNGSIISAKAEKQEPLNDEVEDGKEREKSPPETFVSSEAIDDNLSDSCLSTNSNTSLLSQQLDRESLLTSANIRLGGCADPKVIVGSILDHHYIHRKASVVGNARLDAYGGMGGGFLASYDRRSYSKTEDATIPPQLDDSRRSGDSNIPKRSVLKWEVGASSECGVRNSNEDSYVVINNLDELLAAQGLVSFSQQDLGQTRQQGLYAIFDGHVGNQAARFSAEKFHEMLIEEQSSLASRDSACLSSIEERAEYILHKAFDRLDKEFCRLCTSDGRDWDCGSTALVAFIVDDVVSLANLGDCRGVVCRSISGDDSGTETADGWEVLDPPGAEDDFVWDRANGGGNDAADSPGSKLYWKELTETHSPLHDGESARIKEANGWIIQETEIPIGQLHRMDIFDEDVVEIVKRCFADRMKHHRSDPVRQIQIARTCGDLAVSRAIGDRDFKAAYNLPSSNMNDNDRPTETGSEGNEEVAKSWEGPLVFLYPEGHSGRFKGDLVSSIPDIKFFKVGQEGVIDEFLLMACDGLWDVMDGDDAVRIAKNLLFDKKLSAKDGAARLAELAQHLGSSDNITVILIRFFWEDEHEAHG